MLLIVSIVCCNAFTKLACAVVNAFICASLLPSAIALPAFLTASNVACLRCDAVRSITR